MSDHQDPTAIDDIQTHIPRAEGESYLDWSQRVRELIIAANTTMLTDLQDPKVAGIILNAARDMDRQEISKVQNSLTEKSIDVASQGIALADEMFGNLGNTNPYLAATPVIRDVPSDHKLADVTLVEGELSDEQRDLNYDTFMTEHRNKTAKQIANQSDDVD